ncbi:MAG TPA: adenosylcobinamide amidohydrolase [Desulfobacterales bacterium]|nr:adenosylcobinamide amidohydrolase [Desulfobacterales bacterium]
MHLDTYYNGVELHRGNKIIYARFLEPHMVVSTCRAAGGLRRDLEYVLNYQSCEPAGHQRRLFRLDPQAYQKLICEPHGLPAAKCATMGTAANMHHAAFITKKFRNLEVTAVVTGGVETNAGRAGDPASVMENQDGFEKLPPARGVPGPGTINIMLFISRPLTEAALIRTIITATEAKTAALQELAVNSRYSNGLATGTGTDQMIAAAPDREGFRLTWAGKHGKLGELIGRAVKKAVKETLAKQNSLTPMGQCSVKIHLERFGCNGASMRAGISRYLGAERAALLESNFTAIIRDPLTVAAIAGMAHIRDKFSWGILPSSCWHEIMGSAAAQTACAVSGRYDKMARYKEILSQVTGPGREDDFLKLCWQSMALGFTDKWPADDEPPGNPQDKTRYETNNPPSLHPRHNVPQPLLANSSG